jgi:hypothetical protein
VPFEIKVDGQTFRTDDLTLAEATVIEKATGTSWLYLNPLRSAEQCQETMIVFLSRSRPRAAAEAFVGALGIRKAIDAVTKVDEDLPDEYEDGLPKAEGGPSTPTS